MDEADKEFLKAAFQDYDEQKELNEYLEDIIEEITDQQFKAIRLMLRQTHLE